MWTPISNFSNVDPRDGIIRLWSSPNIMDGDWRITGIFGRDIFHYFFIPSGFFWETSTNTFRYNTHGFRFQFQNVSVTTSNSTGVTDGFWQNVDGGNPDCPLYTDKLFKLPYLLFPSLGGVAEKGQRTYFIPLGVNI